MAKYGSILSHLGLVLEFAGLSLIVPAVLSGVLGEGLYFAFVIPAIISFAAGSFLDWRFGKEKLDFGTTVMLAALSFIFVSLIGAVPFMPYLSPLDALFESVSGFTTTGLTVMSPEGMPVSLLLWRSMTQWLGGLSVLLIFILTLPSLGIPSHYFHKTEPSERIGSGIFRSLRKISAIYLSYTLLGILLFALAGMSLFDAMAHSMTSISTGGFSTRNGSLGAFGNPAVNAVACVLMILGATSFVLHEGLWNRRFIEYIRNPEARLFWPVVAIFSAALLVSGTGLDQALFNVISAITTTGFTVSGIGAGSQISIIFILMLIGGFSCSAAGGIKLIRAFAIGKGLYWHGKKALLPREAVVPFRAGKAFLEENQLVEIFLFSLAYIVLLAAVACALWGMGYPPLASLFQAAAVQGNSAFSVIPVAQMPAVGKLLLMAGMLLGRLEIFPFVTLVIALVRFRKQPF